MAMPIQNTEPEQEGLDFLGNMNRALPGESLTANPDEPRAWEKPPEFTTMKDALEHVLGLLIKEKTYVSIVGAIGKGVPISDVVQQILYIGFTKGKWNPDLMLLLVEPTIYIVMWLADQAGIDATLDSDGDNWEEDDEMMANMAEDSKRMKPNNMPQSLLAQMGEFSGEVA